MDHGALRAQPSGTLRLHKALVAAAIVFLAGPDAGFITGSVIDVNGGFTA